MKLSKKALIWVLMVLTVCVGMAVAACSSPPPAEKPTAEEPAPKPEIVPPTPNEFGVVTADQWKDAYPDEYATYQLNADNSARTDYVTDNPYIVTLYDGGGFAKFYDSAIGHVYTLEDVANTGRPHKLANCLTCKSPEMTALVNRDGDSVYSQPFEDVYTTLDEPVSCFNCHENTGDQLVVTHSYLKNALGSDLSKVDPKTAVCGQCHNEYYFNGETKAATLPWSGLDEMTPEKMLAYYNELGFVDMTNSISGAEMVKVQHPEFETVLGAGSKMQSMGNLSCASCHMGTTTNAAGDSYASHNWVSPLKNTALIESSCKSCHADLASEVAALQKATTDRENTIGAKLADLHTKIGAAAADGSKTEAELAELRSTVRDAQFYWDFVFVENSEGAHNSTLTKDLLDKAESLADGALAKL